MNENLSAQEIQEMRSRLAAIDRVQATIEFELDGTIVTANQNFLDAIGYSLDEIRGRHHRMFVEPSYAASPDYKRFWEDIRAGQFKSDEFKRLAKGGREIWIQASYNPIFDENGRAYRVVKYATDVTERTVTIHNACRVISAIAHGDLTQRMSGQYEGIFKQLAENINGTVAQLQSLVGQIFDSSDNIAQRVEEIATGNSALSQRSQDEACALQDTSSILEELTTTVQQNATSAQQATTLAKDARGLATRGKDVMSEAEVAMGEINDASKRIADITSIIDRIAFQTNLLALNAAVEAARAGEQGRGFAVVAGEVRSLANQSAEAAKEIKGLINDSVSKVSEGVNLVSRSGETLQEIVNAVQKVSSIIEEIASASSEQAISIEKVNSSVGQAEMIVQQNVSMAEQIAAASDTLEEEVRTLESAVEVFSLEEDEGGGWEQGDPRQYTARA